MTLTAHPPPKRSRLHRALELVPAPELVVLGAVAAAAVLLSLLTGGHHASAAADVLRGTLAALLLFGVCGEAITRLLIPRRWGPLRLGFIAPLGAITSGFVLLWWGVLRVPLQVSLWLTLALGILASVLVRRRERTRSPAAVGEPLISRKVAAAWTAILVILFLVAMLPAWRTGAATIYGQNPDAHQVTGVAVLFQHDPPTAVDPRLPIDVMPPAWRFRYPIFYPLAAASNLAHLDPIAVFPSLSALLLVIAAFGFGAFALLALRAPPAAAAAASAAVGFSVINLHLAWHPYWNQLWCLAMLPLTLLAAFWAVEQGGRNAWATLALSMLMLAVAYPLALPDAIVVLLALMLAHRRRPHLSRPSGVIGWIGASVAALAVLITVVGALAKLSQGLGQFFSAHGNLWGGDVLHFLPVGAFLGTGGGVLPALVVCAAAVLCLRGLPRATAIALAAGVLLLGLVDIRFRLAASGAYMDFKQLSFVGPVVLTMAVVGAFRLLQTRRGVLAALGLVLVATWGAAALIQDHREVEGTDEQVTPDLLQIREWARRLPSGASVRVDIPPSGLQLWGVYMLAAHPVDAPHPVDNSTYAYAPHGLRADFSLSLRYFPSSDPAVKVPFPRGRYTVGAPLFANSTFVLRRVRWPARLRSVRSTASRTLVEP